MEPLNFSPHGEDTRLEAWLRQPAASLPDDGFSTRVLAALPLTVGPSDVFSRRARVPWARLAAGAVGGLVGAAAAYSTGSSLGLPLGARESLLSSLSDPSTLTSLMITAVAVLYALRPRAIFRSLR